MSYRSTLLGCGKYAPKRVMTNDEIALAVDTSDEWIFTRTGIRRRHIAAPEETTTSLAIEAARDALASASINGGEIDLTIVATSTPDYGFPASACLVQDAVGAHGGAFDLEAACSGFVYALALADSMIRIGSVRNALIIGSELYSRVLNWQDRSTCILFGDGAGAVVLSRAAQPGPLPRFTLGSDGSGGPLLTMYNGGVPEPSNATPGGVRMNGPETFKFGVRILVDVTEQVLRDEGLSTCDVDWLVPHQANQRIITAATKRLGFAYERVLSNIEEYGNTSAASIPLALAECVERGEVLPGHRVLTVGFGAGLTWAGGLLTWRT
ncbi:MAG: ketoacyl-ACP synthase [Chloroflexi bacterium]|nr:ketoacyl-ACP synthase [Chloroflexota bacterium]